MKQKDQLGKLFKRIRSVKKSKQLNYLDLVELAQKSKFPVYSLWIVLKAFPNNQEKRDKKYSPEGWIDISLENKIIELQEENERLRKSRIPIPLANMDKRWKIALGITVIIALAVTIPLIFSTQNLAEQTEKLADEKEKTVEEKEVLEEQVEEYDNITKKQEEELTHLTDSVENVKDRIRYLSGLLYQKNDLIKNKNKDIENLNDEIKNLKSQIRRLNETIDDIEQTKKFQLRKIDILEKKIREINDVNFNLGVSYYKTKDCKGKYIQGERLYFDTYHDVRIRSIKVDARRSRYAEFIIFDNVTKKYDRKKIRLRKGKQTVNLNMVVSEGSGHFISSNGVKLYALKECFDFPYSVPNLITLKRGESSYYPSYFDWVVSVSI